MSLAAIFRSLPAIGQRYESQLDRVRPTQPPFAPHATTAALLAALSLDSPLPLGERQDLHVDRCASSGARARRRLRVPRGPVWRGRRDRLVSGPASSHADIVGGSLPAPSRLTQLSAPAGGTLH